MSAAQLGAELLRPLTDRSVLIGMLSFLALLTLARAAGLLGLWLLIITVPAVCRFLVEVMQARIENRPVATPGIEMFSLIDSLWTLLPLLQIVLGVAAVGAVADLFGAVAATITATLLGIVLPASFGMLGLTHSLASALDPRNLARLIQAIGPGYVLLPGVCAAAGGLLAWLRLAGAPIFALQAGEVYLLFALFSLTGAFVGLTGARDLLGTPEPDALPNDDARGRTLEREQKAVLTHAYGLASRGNGNGGLRHIEEFIDRSTHFGDKIEQFRWFFQRMLEWDDTEPGLLLGQRLLHRLVARDAQADALKILSRCYHENPSFHPLPEDHDQLRAMAQAAKRQDLVELLEGNGYA